MRILGDDEMNMRPDVSFFMPIYRPNLLWLREAVESIVALMRKSGVRSELLLGDDGSPEPVDLEPLRAMAPELIRTWRFPVNRGIGATSTELSKLAYGRYVASFDQDDVMLPFDLDGEVEFLDGHPEFCASYAQKFLFNENGLTGDVHGDILSPFQAFFSPKVNINAMLIRREVLQAHGYFKPVPGSRINHDVWLMLRLEEDGELYFSRGPRALYRVHGGQNSNVEDAKDWLLIGQDIACRHPQQYRELLFADRPGAGDSPQERVLLHKLAGLVLYINQRNPVMVAKMLDYATENFPDDFGVWECRLHVMASGGDPDLCLKVYRQAEERFGGNPEIMLVLSREALVAMRARGRNCPEIADMYMRLEKRRSAPPPIVSEAMSRVRSKEGPRHPSYSWK